MVWNFSETFVVYILVITVSNEARTCVGRSRASLTPSSGVEVSNLFALSANILVLQATNKDLLAYRAGN